jgi:hypothetical protein
MYLTRNKLVYFCLFAASAIGLRAQADFRSEIEKLLPPTDCKVDIMGIAYPRRSQELAEKMRVAVAANKDWFLNYIKQNSREKTGEALPYDERMGLTKSEYIEFLSLGKKMVMQKIGETALTVTTNAGIYQFHCARELPDLDQIKIDLRSLTITTPFGIMTNSAPNTSQGGGAIGPFSGYQWKFEKGDEDLNNATTVSFLVGEEKSTGRNFIYYTGAIVKLKKAISNATVLILYDKPH